ncbi:GATA transcription factor 18-like [Lotus japonicus]|uniref:GATA transcription factor 18-like n=1 Tax=Lotus japonicus TaxID=34305 RepID=UPI002583C784|nr:GATA transcription factor 18-like [Lotus japonicus]XP_057422422.1 GATA transcription factor 18-like [Lotus japonicus]
MMHHCGGCSQGHMMGTCTCGMFHNTEPNSYSMAFFSMPTQLPYDDYESDMYPFTPSPTSAVDCTLSLGTPSTRLTEDEGGRRNRHERRSSATNNFGWENSSKPQTKASRGSHNGNSNNDSLLARRCANCDTTSTPLWRNGPRGPKSLCNACGIRFKKEERRANAAATATPAGAASGYGSSWYGAQSQIGNELRFMDDSDRDSENGIPFLSWRLNVEHY